MADRKKEWMPVPGYEGVYAVSNDGDVMSMSYKRTGIPGLLSPQDNTYGYLKVMLMREGKWKSFSVHSLVMASFVGPRPYRMDINHLNGDKKDNRVENLQYCTTSENMRHLHASGKGNSCKGESHPSAKLTDANVREIYRLRKLQFTNKEIANMLGGVSVLSVTRAAAGVTWKHLYEEFAAS